MNFIYELLSLAFLIVLWLSCVFEAFDGLSGGRIRKIEAKDPELAEKLEDYLEQDDVIRAILKLLQFVTASAFGVLAYLSLSRFAGEIFTQKWWWAVVFAAAALVIAVSEIIARLVLFRLDIFILRVSVPFLIFLAGTLFLPLTWGVKRVRSTTEDWYKHDAEQEKASVEDEILSYVESYNDDSESDLEEDEKQMIRGILEIGDMSVREIMTPRVDLFALPSTAGIAEAKKLFLASGHSRIPVYGRSIDEIRGILYAKDFIDESVFAGKTLPELAHPPIFIPETKNVGDLLEEIKRSRNHFAVIIDEYGGTSGIVTLEDVIEEIVGEIHDEYDTELDFRNKPQLMPDGSIVLEARTMISDINDIAGTRIPENDAADTIGGYICSELGRIPGEGAVFVIPNQVKATILKADKRKIQTIKLELLEDENDKDA